MSAVFYDRNTNDETRRKELYNGDLYVYSPTDAMQRLCDVAREMCESAFAPHHPTLAQHHLTKDEFSEVLKTLKPAFIHDDRCKKAIRDILAEQGCDLEKTYFDVPRLRTATANEYLTSGLAYAFKPHRDTWYSPPQCQLNWWLPVYEVEANNCMAFHTRYWNTPIRNSSEEFNYQDWNVGGRKAAHNQGSKDTRRQSEALEPVELDPQLRLVTEPGGLVLFSAAHLHSTVPNTTERTRVSIDFRTVHLDELKTNGGAPNIDSACTGTTIEDYIRASDFSKMPEDLVRAYSQLPTSAARPVLEPANA